ncbi:hypothetical protein BZL29_4922 [Mycobacterium kansasii]|uniref:Uncharacterized protein n=1 Tax=Mycobacterium kansasii TaxID=1768 RepID=A0A1V3X3Z8_MYCKA|nr:hypothetical protein BZL29_4922 [Mycobacterium kansasii]
MFGGNGGNGGAGGVGGLLYGDGGAGGPVALRRPPVVTAASGCRRQRRVVG